MIAKYVSFGVFGVALLGAVGASAAELPKGKFRGETPNKKECFLELDQGKYPVKGVTNATTSLGGRTNRVVAGFTADRSHLSGGSLNNAAGERIVGAPILYLKVTDVKLSVGLDGNGDPAYYELKRTPITIVGKLPSSTKTCDHLQRIE